jgi:hypothetical protein
MKHLFAVLIAFSSIASFAQQPSWLGTNVGDGIIYSEYQMFDHGVVSSFRTIAQNTVTDTSLEWNFITALGDYSINWRPYTTGQIYGPFNTIVDPSIDESSARYNTEFGGQPCAMANVQAGFYYTFVVQNNETSDNQMCINETAFDPVVMDTVYHGPVIPTENDMVTFTVELDGSLMPSVGEHIFIRYSIDGFANSQFAEITNFSDGIGTVTVPAFSPDTTVTYYALSTAATAPDAATIDYFTLYFGNNVNQNYEFTVSSITAIEKEQSELQVLFSTDHLQVTGIEKATSVLVLDINGKLVIQDVLTGNSIIPFAGLSKAAYILKVEGYPSQKFVIN